MYVVFYICVIVVVLLVLAVCFNTVGVTEIKETVFVSYICDLKKTVRVIIGFELFI